MSAGNFPAFAGLPGLTVALAPTSIDSCHCHCKQFLAAHGDACSRLPAGCLVFAGCGQHEEIAHYTVPKPELIDPTLVSSAKPPAADTETRTLGLIIPLPGTGWFFKLTGDAAAVEKQEEAFTQFVKSLKFSEGPDPKPSWTLPEGWKDKPGSGMRYATIQVPGEEAAGPVDHSAAGNRWRGGERKH